MEWMLVRLAGKVWLVEKTQGEGMVVVAGKMGSEKKKGRYTNLFSVGERQWFLDSELLGTLEEMTLGAVHLDGNHLAKFLTLDTEGQDKEAKKLLKKRKDPWTYVDLVLTITLVILFGFLLLR